MPKRPLAIEEAELLAEMGFQPTPEPNPDCRPDNAPANWKPVQLDPEDRRNGRHVKWLRPARKQLLRKLTIGTDEVDDSYTPAGLRQGLIDELDALIEAALPSIELNGTGRALIASGQTTSDVAAHLSTHEGGDAELIMTAISRLVWSIEVAGREAGSEDRLDAYWEGLRIAQAFARQLMWRERRALAAGVKDQRSGREGGLRRRAVRGSSPDDPDRLMVDERDRRIEKAAKRIIVEKGNQVSTSELARLLTKPTQGFGLSEGRLRAIIARMRKELNR